MLQAYVQIPADGAGKKLAQQSYTNVNGDLVHRSITSDSPNDPQVAALNSSIAAGDTVDLNCPAIPTGKTGRLVRWIISSSSPCVCTVKLLDQAGTATGKGGVRLNGYQPFSFEPPHRDYWSQAQGAGGLAKFRLTVQNLDLTQVNELLTTAFYDLDS